MASIRGGWSARPGAAGRDHDQGLCQEHAALHAGREHRDLGVGLQRHSRDDASTSWCKAPAAVDFQRVMEAVQSRLELLAGLGGEPPGDLVVLGQQGGAGPSPRATSSKTVPASPWGTSWGRIAVTSPCWRASSPRSGRRGRGSAASSSSCPCRCGPAGRSVRRPRSSGWASSRRAGPANRRLTSRSATCAICR